MEVCPLVEEAADLFRKGTDPLARGIAVVAELPEGLPPVLADAGRLMQVLLNLLGNAHEAILRRRPARAGSSCGPSGPSTARPTA